MDYTISTNEEQELGLDWQYENYVNHESFPTKELWLQNLVDVRLLNPMISIYQRDHSVALEASVRTIPEENQAKAVTEIGAVITSNGGTIVSPVPPNPILAGSTIAPPPRIGI